MSGLPIYSSQSFFLNICIFTLEQVQRNYVKMTLKQISSLQQGVVISKPGLLMIQYLTSTLVFKCTLWVLMIVPRSFRGLNQNCLAKLLLSTKSFGFDPARPLSLHFRYFILMTLDFASQIRESVIRICIKHCYFP